MKLLTVDVSKHIEKKGQFKYLSWPFAVAELKKGYADAHWEVTMFDGKPYSHTPAGCFVQVGVSVEGMKYQKHDHPVLDNKNKPILEPNAFEINTSIMRCLVKTIALTTGLGLYIYAGEDLPCFEDAKPVTLKDAEGIIKGATSMQDLQNRWATNYKSFEKELSLSDFEKVVRAKDGKKSDFQMAK